ncbi:MAG: GGDEF-domain containing protein, partial [Arthrobacter sp.]|nr:GGDEF-domain containing protein [Arthrobacter sp.]
MVTHKGADRRAVSAGAGHDPGMLLSCALLGMAGLYLAGLAFRSNMAFSPLVDGLLALLSVWFPAAVGWLIAFRTRFRRTDILFAAAAVTCQAAGTTYWVLKSATGEHVPLPSPADIGYLGFLVLMLAALAVVVRRRLNEMAWPVLLDVAVGTLGAAAVLTVMLEPILHSALDGPLTAATALGVAYPLLDLLLVTAVVGIAATPDRNIGRGWILLGLCLLTITGANFGYALLELRGLYVVGTPLDGTWSLGLA